jgi:hypothetical protein
MPFPTSADGNGGAWGRPNLAAEMEAISSGVATYESSCKKAQLAPFLQPLGVAWKAQGRFAGRGTPTGAAGG